MSIKVSKFLFSFFHFTSAMFHITWISSGTGVNVGVTGGGIFFIISTGDEVSDWNQKRQKDKIVLDLIVNFPAQK